ncbi:MAG: hypothetical protein JO227_01335 [Acetobacteraceae bacterium]|nr:hypothetical protein [Acetobacteraceae bacterium]
MKSSARLLAGLAFLGAALAVLLGLEVWAGLPGAQQVPGTAAGIEYALPAPHRDQVRQASDAQTNLIAGILARPLFDPDRRPEPQTANATVAGLARLSAIMVSPSGSMAIFAPEGGKPVAVAEGGHIGAYEVRAIHPGEVTVAGPDGVRVVRPAFGTGAAPAAPSGAAARPPLVLPPLRPPPARQ